MSEKHEQLRSLIKRFVARHNNVTENSLPPFDDSHSFLEQGDLDSLGFINLLLFLSQETAQEPDFSDIDPTRLGTVGEIISLYVQSTPDCRPGGAKSPLEYRCSRPRHEA